MRVASLLACLIAAGSAHAATPTIAVMPLRDLGAGRPSVGAALRETLTVDLRGTTGVRVVEREAIDRILREQSVDGKRELEGVLGVRLGTLLGASHLVTGAYQRERGTLRVTARIIAVESGQIVGSAKVDGELESLLELEDRVSATLLASVGWKAQKLPLDAPKRLRPRLTAKVIERFGDAALEPDTAKKKAILKEVVAQSPQFGYAVTELAALEGRLAGYEATSAEHFSALERTGLTAATDARSAPATRAAKIRELLGGMRNTRRYHALLAACDALPNPPADVLEVVQFHRFLALEGLRRNDLALAAGEKLLATYPSSAHFAETETRMRAIAEVKRTRAERHAEYEADVKEKREHIEKKKGGRLDADAQVEWNWTPCIASRWTRQVDQTMLDGCTAYLAKHGEDQQPSALEHAKYARLFVILALGELGRFPDARREIAAYRKRYPGGDEEIDKKLSEWPTD